MCAFVSEEEKKCPLLLNEGKKRELIFVGMSLLIDASHKMSTIRDHSSPLPPDPLFYSPSALQQLLPSSLFLLRCVCDALAASRWFSCCRVSRRFRPRRRKRRLFLLTSFEGVRNAEDQCRCSFGQRIVPGVSRECLGNGCFKTGD